MHEILHTEPREAGLSEVLRMAVPIILGTFSFTIMQFVDQWMVAQLGEDALAAVGSAGVWSFTMSTFILGVVGCVATFASQSLGRGEKANCARYTWQGIYISIAAGVIAACLWPLSNPLFGLMGHTEEVTRLEVLYFNIRLLGYVFIAWQAALASFFQAVSKPRIPMYVAIVANVLNIVLDYLLIFGAFGFPAWGIGGAAAATVISLLVQVVLMQAVFMNRTFHSEFFTRHAYGFDWKKTRELVRIGWPGGLTFLMDVMTWAVFTSFFVGRFGGTMQLAAHSAAMNFMHISFMPVAGLSSAVTPIVGQWLGRGDITTAKSRAYTALRLAIPYMLFMGVLFVLFGPQFMSLFTENPDTIRLGHTLLILAAIFQGFDATNITMIGALRGVGDTRWMMRTFFIAGYFLFMPIALALALLFETAAIGAWIGATVYITALSGLLFYRFHSERWRDVRIFDEDRLVSDGMLSPISRENPEGDVQPETPNA